MSTTLPPSAQALMSHLQDLHAGTEEIDERILALFDLPPGSLAPTRDLADTKALINEKYYWWMVTRRKNMAEWDAPNPVNGRHPYLARAGLHSNNERSGNRIGADGHGHTAEMALCAAYIHASKIMKNV